MKGRLVSLDCYIPACDTSLGRLPVLIGSGPDAEIRLDEASVSPLHCRIFQIDGTVVVEDLESVHGTFVNGTRVKQSPLLPGDSLGIGTRSFFLRCIEVNSPSWSSNEERSSRRAAQWVDAPSLVAAAL